MQVDSKKISLDNRYLSFLIVIKNMSTKKSIDLIYFRKENNICRYFKRFFKSSKFTKIKKIIQKIDKELEDIFFLYIYIKFNFEDF